MVTDISADGKMTNINVVNDLQLTHGENVKQW